MVKINLLPPEIKLKLKQSKTSANVFSICLVVVLVFGLICFALYELNNNYLSVTLQSTQSDVKNAQETLGSFDELANKAIFINDRAKLATSIETKRAVWSVIAQDLLNSVPTDVQFTSLTVDTAKTPNFVLQGNTTSEREAIKFRDKLESSGFFKDVAFKSSTISGGTSGTAAPTPAAQSLTFTLEFNAEALNPKDVKTGATK